MTDVTLTEFIAILAIEQAQHEQRLHGALMEAAVLVQTEAKAEIGHYQGAIGPLAPWEELADSTKEDRVASGFTENDPLLRTGELQNSIEIAVEVRGNKGLAVVGSESEIALFQELGTVKIPPRSYLGGALMRKAPEVAHTIGQSFFSHLFGNGGQRRLP